MEKNVKSPDKSDPVLQFYEYYKLKECPYGVAFSIAFEVYE